MRSDGSVFVWGSGSYNEHGTGIVGGSDLVDRLYFYTPRRVMNLPSGVRIVSTCILKTTGDVFVSWPTGIVLSHATMAGSSGVW